MKFNFDDTECKAYGAALHAAGIRLDSDAVKAATVVAKSGIKYYASKKQGQAFKASLVVRGYWDAVDSEETEVEGLDI